MEYCSSSPVAHGGGRSCQGPESRQAEPMDIDRKGQEATAMNLFRHQIADVFSEHITEFSQTISELGPARSGLLLLLCHGFYDLLEDCLRIQLQLCD